MILVGVELIISATEIAEKLHGVVMEKCVGLRVVTSEDGEKAFLDLSQNICYVGSLHNHKHGGERL